MPMINLSLDHGRTIVEARIALEKSVADIQSMFGAMIRRADWAPDRDRVRLHGPGFWIELRVDDRQVHASGEIPALANLLGGGLRKVLEGRFPRQIP